MGHYKMTCKKKLKGIETSFTLTNITDVMFAWAMEEIDKKKKDALLPHLAQTEAVRREKNHFPQNFRAYILLQSKNTQRQWRAYS